MLEIGSYQPFSRTNSCICLSTPNITTSPTTIKIIPSTFTNKPLGLVIQPSFVIALFGFRQDLLEWAHDQEAAQAIGPVYISIKRD